MSPFKSSLARSAGKLIGLANQADLSLRGNLQSARLSVFEATGGIIVTNTSNTANWHVFTSPGAFAANRLGKQIEVLCVAGGGGGGGAYYAGGGGAGGILHGTFDLGDTNLAVTVGSGGDSPNSSAARGNPGSNSSFGPQITAISGGGGGSYSAASTGLTGGSGGGHSGYNSSSATPVTAQPSIPQMTSYGNVGGVGGSYGAGGGGGSGAVGQNGAPGSGGDGGNGAPFSNFPGTEIYNQASGSLQAILTTAWRDAVTTNGYYAGGGGGANYAGNSGLGDGGLGGGAPGQGSAQGSPFPDAVDYTGGGGGGANYGYNNPSDLSGSNGGNGIVIVRYAL